MAHAQQRKDLFKTWRCPLYPGWNNRPISQIPECICAISHNATFCNRNVHMCAHFCYKMVHCGIIVWRSRVGHFWHLGTIVQIQIQITLFDCKHTAFVHFHPDHWGHKMHLSSCQPLDSDITTSANLWKNNFSDLFSLSVHKLTPVVNHAENSKTKHFSIQTIKSG